MKKIRLRCPAKINLFLKILNKRKDNYHNIETIFEKISLFDTISIKEIPHDSILITTNTKQLPLDSANLCYKATDQIKKMFRIDAGVHIDIEKNIPIAGGLGGGSSNAAAVLKGLNSLWNLKIGRNLLIKLAKKLGSDVALFISNFSYILGKERGDKIFELKKLEDIKLWHVLICPKLEVSTAFAYSLYESHKRILNNKVRHTARPSKLKLTIPNYDVNIINHAILSRDVCLLDCYTYNDFSSFVFHRFKGLNSLKLKIEKISKKFVHLSGSGSTLFTIHKGRKEAFDLARELERIVGGCRLFVVSTYNNN